MFLATRDLCTIPIRYPLPAIEGTREQTLGISANNPPNLCDRNIFQSSDPIARNGNVFRLVLRVLDRSLRRIMEQRQYHKGRSRGSYVLGLILTFYHARWVCG